jgi:hypothetical protein
MPRVRSLDLDVQSHRKYLRRYIASLKRKDLKWGKNYESFIEQLLVVFSDHPPISWRFIVTTYKFPAFRVFNKQTGKLNDFVRVHAWGIIVSSKFFDEKYRNLFPVKKGFYGTADEVRINFRNFGGRKQKEYVEAIASLIANNGDITLNFNAHV